MEYWISKNGNKQGPMMEWDVRDMIREGELTEKDLIWHADLPKWEKLADYSGFQSDFQKPPELTEEDAELERAKAALKQRIEEVTGKKVPDDAIIRVEKVKEHYWVRRGFAKVFDLYLYFVSFFVVANYLGLQFGVDPELSWLMFIYLVPFFILEGFSLYFFGGTPGKYILGLKVRSLEGMPPLNYNRSVLRSAMSWFFGMALGLPQVFFISMVLSYFSTKKRGLTTWDAVARTVVVTQRSVNALSIIAYVILTFTISGLFSSFVNAHEPTRDTMVKTALEHAPQALKEQIRKTYNIPESSEE